MDRIELLKAMMEESGEDCFLLHALGLEHVKIGDDMQARAYFERALSIDADYIGAYYHVAKLYERMGEKQKAVDAYQEGMRRAKQCGDQHSYNELMHAMEDLE